MLVNGQEVERTDSLRKDAVRIFIDCQRCDINYIRNEIPYVNYVRDVKEAQVYILETRQSTGSGGSAYTFFFNGQEKFEGMNDTITYNSYQDNTYDQTREGRTQILRMGLMRYVAKTPLVNEVEISHKGEMEQVEVVDNWNSWVFEIDFDPNFEIEESRKQVVWENSAAAYRITPDWKLEFEIDQDFRNTKYIYDDTTYNLNRTSWSQDNLIVKSLSDHWSAGVQFDVSSSSYRNIKSSFDIYPSIEYNIYPYSQSTQRQLRVLYGVGFIMNNYRDTTVYDMIKENLVEQKLDIAYRVQQKWGSINMSLEASNYMHDFSKNRLELDGSIRIRIVKGLSFSIRGSAARIHNQLALPKGDLDEAEILLELQELATEYSFDGGVGFTYTFGSIFNNVVNPRFGH